MMLLQLQWRMVPSVVHLYCIACFKKNFILFLGVRDFIILYCNILKNYYYYSLMCILICVYKIIIMYMGLI